VSAAEEPVVAVRGLVHPFDGGDPDPGPDAGARPGLWIDQLDVMPGQVVILTGPSGSGKTTLLTLVGALRRVRRGRARVLGRDLEALDDAGRVALRREVGFIFQAHNLLRALTAEQNVRMAVELAERDPARVRERAAEVLRLVGLADKARSKPAALSGGERQRVAIARALANRPRLVLADEPTAALDEKRGLDVIHLLEDLARNRGTASVVVTHDSRILEFADRIVHLREGRVRSDTQVQKQLEVCEFLKQCEVFSRLTLSTLADIAEKMRPERHPAGAEVVRRGEPGDKFYLIRQGAVDLVAEGAVMATLGRGQFFGEAALLRGGPAEASAVAREPLAVYALGKDDFLAALAASEPFRRELERILFQRR
jgi:putative ABC transport system ATP-binding protein